MGLSDACYDFSLQLREPQSDAARREAVEAFRREIKYYSEPPFCYGDELTTLAAACTEFLDGRTTSNADPLQRVTFLADAIRDHLDAPPSAGGLTS